MQLAYARVTDDAGIDQFVCGFRNIDAVIAAEKEKNALYRMAHVDSMTGIGNRRAFDEYMDSYIGKKPESDLALFSFDLNELKLANDTYGHEAGDELITGAADCMKKAFGSEGSVYRIGGDEFAAFIRCDAARYIKIAEKLGELFRSWNGKYSHGISIATGHVRSDEAPDKSIQELNREAEDDLYDGTIYPPLENVPKRLAIIKRNEWMVDHSDVIVAYVLHEWGGANIMLQYATRKGKEVIRYT